MSKASIARYRTERKAELLRLADVLRQRCSSTCRNIETITAAANSCGKGTGQFCEYSIERLVFLLPQFRRSIPVSNTLKNITLTLSLQTVSRCEEGNIVNDPFVEYSLDIVINGVCSDDKPVMCSWHLDKDIPLENEDAVQEFIHPYYHFHFGGRHMYNSGHDFGSTLILESPRIAHPPMDAILGVDFILTNYFQSSTLSFREESVYKSILKASQERVWKPYANIINNKWEAFKGGSEWHPTKIWPQLLR